MRSYALRRLLSIVPTLLMVATLVFILVRLVPGGPFDQERAVPAEVERALNAKYHLDDPVWKQYGDWLWALLSRGDLGPTFKYPNRTVNEIIALSLPVSMQLGSLAMLFALAVGVPLGVIGAVRQNTWKDTAAMAAAMVGVSVPRFVLAPLLILIFSLHLYIFPVARWETWRHMVLPVICAGLPAAAYIARLTRGGMLEVIRSDFIRTARAKGLSERVVMFKHVLKNAMIPIITSIVIEIPFLITGALLIENFFGIPGLGSQLVDAFNTSDLPVIKAQVVMFSILYMVFNLLTDVLYAAVDPRVSLK
ncbi:MAG: ABC transporter permease [Bdellovibrionales bacterium]|nr:ABC transporter permease [Bdellovibrionales bacterium]